MDVWDKFHAAWGRRAVGVIVDVAGDGCQRGAEFRRCLGLVRGRLQARYNRLVRRFGGDKNPGAKKKAITAIAHTVLKIAYQVLKSGQPYTEPGADFYTRRESPEQKHAWLERQLQKLHPGCTITIAISSPEAAFGPGA